MNKTVCIAILNYNGIEFLEELVPSLTTAVAAWNGPCNVVILDNHSTAPVEAWAKQNCPEFEFVRASENKFFFSYNDLIFERSEDIFILLNNDIKVDPNFIGPLVKRFDADDVFAVGATSKDWEGRKYTTGPWFLGVRKGLYFWDWCREKQLASHTLLTVGGHMAVDRAKFVELGGFNPLFYPAYCEETELCLRAWRRGWRCIFEPASLVYHYDGGSFNKTSSKAAVQLRSYFLLQLACLPPIKPRLLSSFFVFLRMLYYAGTLKFYWPRTYLQTRFEWARVEKHHRTLKMNDEELRAILRSISAPLS